MDNQIPSETAGSSYTASTALESERTKAPTTALSLLAEIESGTASDLVMAIRYETSPPGPTFLPALDEILLQSRPHRAGSSLQRGDLVEIVGPTGSGKTMLLRFLLMTHLLPRHLNLSGSSSEINAQVDLGGKQMTCALIHPSTHASPVFSLAKSMRAHVKTCLDGDINAQNFFISERTFKEGNIGGAGKKLSVKLQMQAMKDEIVENVVKESLRRLKVITPSKSRWSGWYLSLTRLLLPLYRQPKGGSESDNDRLDLVVCDGFGDGFWPERWNEEQLSISGRRRSRLGLRGLEDVGLKDVIEVINTIRKETGAVVVLSVQGLWTIKDKPFYTPHLPPPYPNPFTRTTKPNPNSNLIDDSSQTLGNLSASTYQSHRPPDLCDSWPLSIQITMKGKLPSLQYPAETTLVDALRNNQINHEEEEQEGGGGLVQRFEGVVRVPGGAGLAGRLSGVEFGFGMGHEGLIPDVL